MWKRIRIWGLKWDLYQLETNMMFYGMPYEEFEQDYKIICDKINKLENEKDN